MLKNMSLIVLPSGLATLAYLLFPRLRLLSTLLGVFVIATISLGHSFIEYISGLGSDSIAELMSFDLGEAYFFLKTLWLVLDVGNVNFKLKVVFAVTATTGVLILFFSWMHFRFRYRVILALSLSILPAVYLAADLIGVVADNYNWYEQNRRNLATPIEFPVPAPSRELTSLILIGESTSVMNLGFYGYFRDTTPEMDELLAHQPGLLLFENVVSTHVHTVPSLIQALTVRPHSDISLPRPVGDEQRIPLTTILTRAGLRTHLVSNQTRSGSWNLTGPLLFENVDSAVYSIDGKYAGNLDWRFPRPDERLFFSENLNYLLDGDSNKSIFLHSYIGHYYYRDKLPAEFNQPVDEFFDGLELPHIFGTDVASPFVLEWLEQSDAAYRYLDNLLAQLVRRIESYDMPAVLIYFADHGDAIYAGVAHDSARFQHEMLRVPFLLHFNEQARVRFPNLYERYRQLSDTQALSTLESLAYTILDLHGIDLPPKLKEEPIGTNFGSRVVPVLVRSVGDGVTYIDLSVSQPGQTFPLARAYVNQATEIFKRVAADSYPDNVLCYHRGNSVAKAARGALVSDCVEMDIMIDDLDRIVVDNDTSSGPALSKMLRVVNNGKTWVWLDGKNLDNGRRCHTLLTTLKSEGSSLLNVLVEFPSHVNLEDDELRDCIKELISINVTTSYYVPTELGLRCQVTESANVSNNSKACVEFNGQVSAAVLSGLIKSLSFDYRLASIMRSREIYRKLQWNVWGIGVQDLVDQHYREVKRIIVDSRSDPNSR